MQKETMNLIVKDLGHKDISTKFALIIPFFI